MGMFSSLFGGGGSAKRSAGHAAEQQRAAGDFVYNQYRQQIAPTFTPYIEAGSGAIKPYEEISSTLPQYTADINQYRGALAPIVEQITSQNLDAYKSSPGYEFRMQEGMKALEGTQAARGGLLSGEALKAAQQYGQNIGTSEYDNYLTRLYNQLGAVGQQIQGAQSGQTSAINSLNPYLQQMQLGQNAAATSGQLGQSAAIYRGNMMAGAGATEASGMQAKDAQMKAAGDQWLSGVATAVTGVPMNFNTSGAGQQSFGAQGGRAPAVMSGGALSPQMSGQSSPWVNPDYLTLPAQDTSLPWYNQQQQQSRQLKTQSVYS